MDIGGSWKNSKRNFDSIYDAIPLLFEIITTEGWLEVMYLATDSRGFDLTPRQDVSKEASIYFISFIIIGNIFLLNLFVGIVIDKFNRLKEQMNGFLLMTRD